MDATLVATVPAILVAFAAASVAPSTPLVAACAARRPSCVAIQFVNMSTPMLMNDDRMESHTLMNACLNDIVRVNRPLSALPMAEVIGETMPFHLRMEALTTSLFPFCT